uniref:Somatotropin n=1 Tax=Siganus guttatus TaxID=92439 RepID=SOMA_SIGGU|nr:RecName: Full=Somatotropin; AltName: Full=Growth hormone; Flags: Precursor [Siganus guttatus]BAA92144.1 growth hormone [Siganus guttatus]
MEKVVLLLSVLSLGVVCPQPMTDSQRFSIAVSRIHYLHQVAQRSFFTFESSLSAEDQRQLNKIFLQDSCNSDYIRSPIDKHETQRSSVMKLLSISYRLVESWEYPSRALIGGSTNQISNKLSELKLGIRLLMEANQDGAEIFPESSAFQLDYQSLGTDDPRQMYELLACFKKDMHKVETYLTVAKCRLSPEANCTL